MSDSIHIDPADGPHAAAGLSDEQVESLCNLMLWELSVRTSERQFMEYLHHRKVLREEHADLVDQVAYERDLMHFEEDVLADLDALPTAQRPLML